MQVLGKGDILLVCWVFFSFKTNICSKQHQDISSKVQVSGISFPHPAPKINKREKEHNILE